MLVKVVRYLRKLAGITPEQLSIKFHKKRSGELINAYFKANSEKRKLQIGCQAHPINGWLNVDILPKNSETVYMDATKKFPLPDNSFDFIFSEHMIEHIGLQDGIFMLSECNRVLKQGGIIRLSTPNLKFLVDLYQEPKSELQKKYIQKSKKYFKDDVLMTDTVVINNFFRDWGHEFIYDSKSLQDILEKAGFKKIIFRKVGESNHFELKNIEKHGFEISEEFNELESVVAEAEK